jgi:hypothetical protein
MLLNASAKTDLPWHLFVRFGSACGPVIVPVFKTGDRYLAIAMMGSTPIRFRHLFLVVLFCG